MILFMFTKKEHWGVQSSLLSLHSAPLSNESIIHDVLISKMI